MSTSHVYVLRAEDVYSGFRKHGDAEIPLEMSREEPMIRILPVIIGALQGLASLDANAACVRGAAGCGAGFHGAGAGARGVGVTHHGTVGAGYHGVGAGARGAPRRRVY